MHQIHPAKLHHYSLLFAGFVIVFLSLIRCINLFLFGDFNDLQANLTSLDNLFFVGLKFDLRLVGIILLLFVYLPYLFIFWIKNQSRYQQGIKGVLSVSLTLIILLSFVEIGYFIFFGTPIDLLIFGLIEDDTQAIIASAISDPRLLIVTAIAIITTVTIVPYYIKTTQRLIKQQKLAFLPQTVGALFFIIPFLIVMARGSIGTFPLSQRQSSVSHNSFINSLTQNAVFHLSYAYSNRQKNNTNQSSLAILNSAQVSNKDELLKKAGFNHANPLIRTTPFNPLLEQQPPHIVFVLMEGWSSHIALNNSPDNPVLGAFKKHAQADYFLPYFFSNQYGTNPSIESLLLNTPLTPLSQSSAYKTSFTMSNLLPFKRNGYRTSFISGGYSSWRNHDVFWPKQGIDDYIDRSKIEEKYHVSSNNPWGVYDADLFRYLQDHLLKQTQPSFSFVLTTNNHPPVRLPPNYSSPSFDVTKMGITNDTDHKNKMLASYRYQTNAFGVFLDWLKRSRLKNKVIVIATGDHILKGFDDYNSAEKQYLRYAVPSYFYLPTVYDQFSKKNKSTVNAQIGSHVDLFPTLFELSLSKASYFAFGHSLIHRSNATAYGWNDQKSMLLRQGVINLKTQKRHHWKPHSTTQLSTKAYPLTAQQLTLITQEKNRRWLKMLLLYEDNEQQN